MAVVAKDEAAIEPLFPAEPAPALFVLVVCQRCFVQKHMMLAEGWDIAGVVHDCASDEPFKVTRK